MAEQIEYMSKQLGNAGFRVHIWPPPVMQGLTHSGNRDRIAVIYTVF